MTLGASQVQSNLEDSPETDRTLVLIDNNLLRTTHSTFFKDLRSRGHRLKIEFLDNDSMKTYPLRIKRDGDYIYDNIILMCTSLNNISKEFSRDIKKFFDSGNNLFFVGDVDTSPQFSDFAKEFGFTFNSQGSSLIDFKNAVNKIDPHVFQVQNFRDIEIVSEGVEGNIIYNGVSLAVSFFENSQTTIFARGNLQTASISRDLSGLPTYNVMGRNNILATGIQGFNNARLLAIGSLDMLSNELYSLSGGANRVYTNNLLDWFVHVRGEIRKISHSMICLDKNGLEVDCPRKCFFKFDIDVSHFIQHECFTYLIACVLELVAESMAPLQCGRNVP